MKSFPLTLLLLFCCCLSVSGADIQYPANTIPEKLSKNANAVVRLHQKEFVVHSPSKATEKVRLVVTILNKDASSAYAHMTVPYDELSKVKSFEGRVYNAAGKQIDKLKKKQIRDVSNFSSFSLFEDNRLKVASMEKNEYPYTIEWTYERETSNMMFYPVWVPPLSEKVSVEKAALLVEMPLNMKLRYLENPFAPACKISQQADKTVYQWQVEQLDVLRPEPFLSPYQEIVPVVITAPEAFEVDGYAGKMDSWESYGNWINMLNSNQNDLPVEAIEKVKELTAGLSRKGKIQAIYNYLQENSRYVSIQLGIGGWQPFKSSFVHEKGYGDCKALSFYTKSLLEAVDIPSYYTLIYAGDDKVDVREDFPTAYFNHVILCVPNEQDTLWLECTSQTNPFGYMGNFTSDRKALVITEEGGKVVKTPAYQQEQNLQQTVAHVKLASSSEAEISFKRSYQGLQFENYSLSHYIHQGPEEQRKWIHKAVEIPRYEIQAFSFSLEEKEVPVASLDAQLLIRNFVSVSGKRCFINLNLANQANFSYPTVKERKHDFFLKQPFIDQDTIVYHLPQGASIEYLPEEQSLKSEFGEYFATAFEQEGKVVYTRTFKLNGGKFAAGKYNNYVKFRQEVMKLDKANMVLLYP